MHLRVRGRRFGARAQILRALDRFHNDYALEGFDAVQPIFDGSAALRAAIPGTAIVEAVYRRMPRRMRAIDSRTRSGVTPSGMAMPIFAVI
jgi:hypothetical protein